MMLTSVSKRESKRNIIIIPTTCRLLTLIAVNCRLLCASLLFSDGWYHEARYLSVQILDIYYHTE